MFGARAVQHSILRGFPNADISVSIVWIQMPGFNDTERTAAQIAATFTDSRVRHYYDPLPAHLAGRAFAQGIIAEGRGPAWDIYFFYEKGRVWKDRPPTPDVYMHQLGGGRRAPADHFRSGDKLVAGLRDAMRDLTGVKSPNGKR